MLLVCLGAAYGTQEATAIFAAFDLQAGVSSRVLQQASAALHAFWRCRNAIMHGNRFASHADMATHMRSIMEDPWLHACSQDLSKKERRRLRIRQPVVLPNYVYYYSDGAARSRDGLRTSSCGAVVVDNGVQLARVGMYLGDVSNNVAEYEGVLLALRHCREHLLSRDGGIVFRVDSMLVQKQLALIWCCRHPALMPLHEECMSILRDLRRSRDGQEVVVEHVYREFNAEADGTANKAIDSYSPARHRDDVVVNEGWFV